MDLKTLADQCTPEQLSALRQLEDRIRLVEAAAKLLDSDPELRTKWTEQKQRTTSTRAKVASLANGVELPKVSQLRKRFEITNRSSRVLTMMSNALRLGKDARPPPRPMTLARGITREAGSGGG